MPLYLNRSFMTKTTGTSTTETWNFGFTPAVGSLLVFHGASSTAWGGSGGTGTDPAGWTRIQYQVQDGGMIAWYKISAGETSLDTTHNGTGSAAFPKWAEIIEYPAGSTVTGSAKAHGTTSVAVPTFSGLTGTNTVWRLVRWSKGTNTGADSVATINVGTTSAQGYSNGTGDGGIYVTTYEENFTGSTTTAATGSVTGSYVPTSAETIAYSVYVAPTSGNSYTGGAQLPAEYVSGGVALMGSLYYIDGSGNEQPLRSYEVV